MWWRLIKSSPNRSYPDWNQRPIIAKFVSQSSLGRNDKLAADFSQRLNAFRYCFFNAAIDAHRICGTHSVNLADMKTSSV
jgi:hypothetical protein